MNLGSVGGTFNWKKVKLNKFFPQINDIRSYTDTHDSISGSGLGSSSRNIIDKKRTKIGVGGSIWKNRNIFCLGLWGKKLKKKVKTP